MSHDYGAIVKQNVPQATRALHKLGLIMTRSYRPSFLCYSAYNVTERIIIDTVCDDMFVGLNSTRVPFFDPGRGLSQRGDNEASKKKKKAQKVSSRAKKHDQKGTV